MRRFLVATIIVARSRASILVCYLNDSWEALNGQRRMKQTLPSLQGHSYATCQAMKKEGHAILNL